MVLVVMVVVVLVLVVCHRDRCAVRTFLWTGFSLSASSVPHAVCHMGSCVYRAFLWTGFSLSTSNVPSCCVSHGTLCCYSLLMDRVLSKYGQCSTMLCITGDVVLLEPSYGPGFL